MINEVVVATLDVQEVRLDVVEAVMCTSAPIYQENTSSTNQEKFHAGESFSIDHAWSTQISLVTVLTCSRTVCTSDSSVSTKTSIEACLVHMARKQMEADDCALTTASSVVVTVYGMIRG